MKIITLIFKKWLPLAIVTAGLCGLVYVTVQQSLRMGANDPQIQMAKDAASAMDNGASADSLVSSETVDIASSLAPFIVIFDDAGKVLASSASLHGSNPSLPSGVLDYTRQNDEDRLTWQPESGVRIAAVVVRYDQGFVLAGRSLREVEKRETQTEQLSGIAMLAIWLVALVAITLQELIWRDKTD